jgi:hypothetical protein
MNMWLARGRAPLRAPALVCRPRTRHCGRRLSCADHARAIAGAGSRVQTTHSVAHAHERGHACTLCIPIRSLVAWAGEERYDGPLSGARDTGLITKITSGERHAYAVSSKTRLAAPRRFRPLVFFWILALFSVMR